ncbi:MAG TPA: tRNA (adenosine(37)-N6)-dimethylallyltransferase MiaA [Gemmatimonadales bacterium]|nr:tRNA (adenosine(37)-N6)-dimethylallyltransferase MiaA [Gemmatimonadales bacterium]
MDAAESAGGARVPVIVGPTAIGKTAVAVALARHWPTLEIISADSRQVYRGLDIGTAKPTRKERAAVPHHGLDVVGPAERYSAGRYARDAAVWLAALHARGRMPALVGGTGLYVRALADGLFHEPPMPPERRRALERVAGTLPAGELVRWAARLDPGYTGGGGRQRALRAIEVALLTGRPLSAWQRDARQAAQIEPWYVVLTAPRAVLHRRIAQRAEEMVRRGMIEEVAAVLAEGCPADAPGLSGIGPRQAVEYLHGQRPRESVAEAVTIATRQYAKRQETWFRHQLAGPVLWLDATRPPERLAAEIAEAWTRAQDRGGAQAERQGGASTVVREGSEGA